MQSWFINSCSAQSTMYPQSLMGEKASDCVHMTLMSMSLLSHNTHLTFCSSHLESYYMGQSTPNLIVLYYEIKAWLMCLYIVVCIYYQRCQWFFGKNLETCGKASGGGGGLSSRGRGELERGGLPLTKNFG